MTPENSPSSGLCQSGIITFNEKWSGKQVNISAILIRSHHKIFMRSNVSLVVCWIMQYNFIQLSRGHVKPVWKETNHIIELIFFDWINHMLCNFAPKVDIPSTCPDIKSHSFICVQYFCCSLFNVRPHLWSTHCTVLMCVCIPQCCNCPNTSRRPVCLRTPSLSAQTSSSTWSRLWGRENKCYHVCMQVYTCAYVCPWVSVSLYVYTLVCIHN